MKKIIFFLLGVLLPIIIRMWFDGFLGSASIVWTAVLTVAAVPLIFVFALPLIGWAIVASIYGYKNKPIVYSYTIGMVLGMAVAFNLDGVTDYFKYNWGIGVK